MPEQQSLWSGLILAKANISDVDLPPNQTTGPDDARKPVCQDLLRGIT